MEIRVRTDGSEEGFDEGVPGFSTMPGSWVGTVVGDVSVEDVEGCELGEDDATVGVVEGGGEGTFF